MEQMEVWNNFDWKIEHWFIFLSVINTKLNCFKLCFDKYNLQHVKPRLIHGTSNLPKTLLLCIGRNENAPLISLKLFFIEVFSQDYVIFKHSLFVCVKKFSNIFYWNSRVKNLAFLCLTDLFDSAIFGNWCRKILTEIPPE